MAGNCDILLCTLNARYAHASMGLRYLRANLGPLRARSAILELEINVRPDVVVESILAHGPRVVGFGVYIWNAAPMLSVLRLLRRVAPEIRVVLGGPEVSYEVEAQEICRLADYVICGEADFAFAQLCTQLLADEAPASRVIQAAPVDVSALALPYHELSGEDIAHRVIYVEASRGCPFRCEFCLSALPGATRSFELEPLLAAFDRLIARGARQLKFVDRTFNLDLRIAQRILEFFLERMQPGLFVHFEMIPDRLPEALRSLIARFPPGTLQLEVGVQSFDPDVCARISRRQDPARVEANLRFLREETGTHLHTDLIFGLPGEDLAGFGRGFDRLLALRPQEIQVGMLKRLRGAPIARHDSSAAMVYSPEPPYEVLRTGALSFGEIQRLRRFARYFDLLYNSGRFPRTAEHLMGAEQDSAFAAFMVFSDWLYAADGRVHRISPGRLSARLFEYLVEAREADAHEVAALLLADHQGAGGRGVPEHLRAFVDPAPTKKPAPPDEIPKHLVRQRRHLAQRGVDAQGAPEQILSQ